ncbi:CaiB/BaiF CoA transferase family protein [Amycolatopsis sacchari]|uniref:CaiB/BaiF CoA transferase family protein n=1 Tax=Amycolatopsis sacchari TaxID=115433 RepID=UPI003EC0C0CA
MLPGLLSGCTVIDLSTLFAGPMAATMLGDHGATVIKVEHPRGDDLRGWGPRRDGQPLWWKVVNRNKRNLALDLHHPAARRALLRLAREADVLISNFRPGRLDAWDLGWEVLHEANPRLILAEVTGFGQEGPYSHLPGFGTLAESMSGFAAVTGHEDGPPLLPPFGLADGIAGMTTAFGITAALSSRARTGLGVRIDTALYEPLMWIVGSHIVEFDQLGIVQRRMGNSVPQTAPRGAYRTKDEQWIALSGAAQTVAARLFTAIGAPEAIRDPRFATNQARVAHRAELDSMIAEWIGQRTRDEALQALREADVAAAPIYDAADITRDPHFRRRGSITTVEDDELGPLTMQGVIPRVVEQPGAIRWSGSSAIGADTEEILTGIGFSPAEIVQMQRDGATRSASTPA